MTDWLKSSNRAQLSERLASARGMLRVYFEPPSCEWDGRYHHDQRRCRECGYGYVCEWIFTHDPDPDASLFTDQQMRDALTFAAGYLEGCMGQAGHRTDDCRCATCAWTRETRALLIDP